MGLFGSSSSTTTNYSGIRGLGLDEAGTGQNAINDTNFGSSLYKNMTGNSYAFPTLDENGLFPQQQNMVSSLLSQALGTNSASLGLRGQLSPENFTNVAASATKDVLPQLATLANTNLTNAYQMPIGFQQNAASLYNTFLSNYPALLGNMSQSKSSGPGLGYGVLTSFAGGLGQGLSSSVASCWIARLLYGETNPIVDLIRSYLLSYQNTDNILGEFTRWYVKNGEGTALYLKRNPRKQLPWKQWFDSLALNAVYVHLNKVAVAV